MPHEPSSEDAREPLFQFLPEATLASYAPYPAHECQFCGRSPKHLEGRPWLIVECLHVRLVICPDCVRKAAAFVAGFETGHTDPSSAATVTPLDKPL